MTDPPLNDSPEAVRLRRAATAWGDNPRPDNAAGAPSKALNAELLAAALAYANAVFHARPVIKSEQPKPRKKSIHAEPVGFKSNEQPERWECTLCHRDKFTKRTPHKCVGGYRKKHLKWRPIYARSGEAAAP